MRETLLDKYVNNAEYDLTKSRIRFSMLSLALDQIARGNIGFMMQTPTRKERTEKGKPNTSAFTRVEKEERSISGCRSQLERLTRAGRWVCAVCN